MSHASKIIAVLCLLFSFTAKADPKKGEIRLGAFIGEWQLRDVRYSWVGQGGQIDVGLNLSGGGLYFGSKGWNDGFYAGGGLAYSGDAGVYGLVGHEARFGPLLVLTEFWSLASTNKSVSALAHIGLGVVW